MKTVLSTLATLIFFVSQVAVSSVYADAPACGDNAKADIVIMIDKTGSITDSDLTLEKTAAKGLLNSFSAAVVNKPRFAIGTFNVEEGPDARIVAGGELTDVYGADNIDPNLDSGLYAAINDINSPNGFTNLSEAFDVAQAELSAHAADAGYADYADYIIIISDGVTNRPSSPTPSSCSTGTPGDSALASATNAKNAGTTIFTLHYGTDSPCAAGTGSAFLLQLSSGPAYYFEANADLSGIFDLIADFLGCNDNDSCTTDTCNDETHLCEFSAVDSDGDGTFDCNDGCPEDPNKTSPGLCGCNQADTDSDNDGTPDCNDSCPNDPTHITPAEEVCNDLDDNCNGLIDEELDCFRDCNGTLHGTAVLDRCGVCGGDGQSCLGCNEVNITDTQFALDGNALALRNAVHKASALLLKLNKAAANKEFVKAVRAQAGALYQDAWTKTWSVPNVLNVCANQVFCVQTSNAGVVESLKSNSDSLLDLVNQVLKRIRAKTKSASRSKSKLSNGANKLHKDSYAKAGQIPLLASSCS